MATVGVKRLMSGISSDQSSAAGRSTTSSYPVRSSLSFRS